MRRTSIFILYFFFSVASGLAINACDYDTGDSPVFEAMATLDQKTAPQTLAMDYDEQAYALDLITTNHWSSADAAFTTVGATPDLAKGSCWDNGPNYNRWFRFQATTNHIDVVLRTGGSEGTMTFPFLALWDATGVELSCARFAGASVDIGLEHNGLTPGEWYYISVDNYAGNSRRGSFALSVNDQALAAYDNRTTAVELSDVNNWSSPDGYYTTVGATADALRASCWTSGPSYNRWFRFQAPTNYVSLVLRTGGSEGSMQYPLVALWDAAGTEIACRKFTSASSDLDIQDMSLTPGEWYYISVDNYANANYQGSFALSVSGFETPDYDDRITALTLTDLAGWASTDGAYTTIGATPDGAKGSCWVNGPSNNRWFRFQATSSYIDLRVRTGGSEGTLQFPFMALWDAAGTELACRSSIVADADLDIQLNNLIPGEWYYLSVDNFGSDLYRGSFSLSANGQPPMDYDFKEQAAVLTDLADWTSPAGAYSTFGASADQAKGSCWTNGPSYNRWFAFQALTTDVHVELRTGAGEGTMQYPFVALWDAAGAELGCANFTSADSDLTIEHDALVPGQWYYISVDNFRGVNYRGTFSLYIDNYNYDYRDYAIELADLNAWQSADQAYSTVWATPDENKGSCWNNGPNYNRWFRFQATTSYVDIRVLTGGTQGTVRFPFLALWDAAGNELTCRKLAVADADVDLQWNALSPGDWYYISVDNFVGEGNRGSFALSLSDQVIAEYDQRAGALTLNDLDHWNSSDGAYTTFNATADGVRPSCWPSGPNFNRWFRFQAQTNYVDVHMLSGGAQGTLAYPMLALWDAAGNEVDCMRFTSAYSNAAIQNNGLIPGEWYFISADNFLNVNYQGSFSLSVNDQEPVSYDTRADALELTDLNNWTSANNAFSTLGATPDGTKGACWNNGPNHNRWFRFQAQSNSIDITVRTGGIEGTMRYPYVALWTAAGAQVACGKFSAADSDVNIQRTNLVPGQAYYISVDHFDNRLYQGSFALSVNGL